MFQAHAPGFNTPAPETFGRVLAYTLHDPATSHYARPQYSPSGSFLQLAPIKGTIAVGSEQTLKIDYTTNNPDEHIRFRYVVSEAGKTLHGGSWRFRPCNVKKSPRKRKKTDPENCHRLQCKSLFNVTEVRTIDRRSITSKTGLFHFFFFFFFVCFPSTGHLLNNSFAITNHSEYTFFQIYIRYNKDKYDIDIIKELQQFIMNCQKDL